jgi:hypothetical protein
MIEIQSILRFESVCGAILMLAGVLAGCSSPSTPRVDIERGSSKEQVIAALGEPDQRRDFVLPEEPFFGPQEGLADQVPAGTSVEEWEYEIGDDVLYVWFTGDDGEASEDGLVLDTARYPRDAVY